MGGEGLKKRGKKRGKDREGETDGYESERKVLKDVGLRWSSKRLAPFAPPFLPISIEQSKSRTKPWLV